MNKSELWWVSVGGNDCEPARVVRTKLDASGSYQLADHAGPRERVEVFTIGCTDGTVIEDGCGVLLVEKIDEVPLTPEQSEKQDRAWQRRRRREEAQGIHHGYRRFD